MKKIELYEVGPRDGFQMVDEYIPLETKVRIVEGLLDAGLRHLQITSFVSPKAIPQMRDAGELASIVVGKYPDADLFALVPESAWCRSGLGIRPEIGVLCRFAEREPQQGQHQSGHMKSPLPGCRRFWSAYPQMDVCLDLSTDIRLPV